METIDVIIPVFQKAEKLFRAVESVKAQTVPVKNIFIIDDGSDEVIQSKIRNRYLSDPQVKLAFLTHSGLPGVSRQLGIQSSTSDWIAFLDQDDKWVPEKLEFQLALAKKYDSKFICSNAVKTSEGGGFQKDYFPRGKKTIPITFTSLLKENRVIMSSVLVQRRVLLKIGTYASSHNVRQADDYATWLRCSSVTKILYDPTPLLEYEVSPKGMSATSDPGIRIFAYADFALWTQNQRILEKKKANALRRRTLGLVRKAFF